MIDQKKIESLLESFYNGTSTPEEEAILRAYFNQATDTEDSRMVDKQLLDVLHDDSRIVDKHLLDVLHDDSRIRLPEGLSERLETSIDKHITVKSRSRTRPFFVGLVGAAAAALLCIGLFWSDNQYNKPSHLADTFTNPEEAAFVAEQALVLVSSKLNMGLAPLEKIKESVAKTNELISENLVLN